MTIYTDQVTGKKYDRMPGGVASATQPTEGYMDCRECAFDVSGKHGEECDRASVQCTLHTGNKAVYFYFKERKA